MCTRDDTGARRFGGAFREHAHRNGSGRQLPTRLFGLEGGAIRMAGMHADANFRSAARQIRVELAQAGVARTHSTSSRTPDMIGG